MEHVYRGASTLVSLLCVLKNDASAEIAVVSSAGQRATAGEFVLPYRRHDLIFSLLENEAHSWSWELRRRQDETLLARSSDEYSSHYEAREAVERLQTSLASATIEE